MFVVEVGTVLTILFTVAELFGYQSQAPARLPDRAGRLAVPDGAVRQLRRGPGRGARQGPGRRPAQDAAGDAGLPAARRRHDRGDRLHRLCGPATGSWSRPARSFPATARSSRASPRSTSRPSPASRPRSSARPAATAPASPAARASSPTASSCEITAGAGKSFLDRMIALVEGAIRQRTPNEIALSLVLAAFTLIFLIVTAALWPMARNAELYMTDYLGTSEPVQEPGHRRADAGGPAGLPDPDDHRRPAGGHRHRRHGPGPAGQHHRQERQGGRGGRRRRHAAAGQDRHHHHRQSPGDAVRARWATTRPARWASWPPWPRSPTRRPRARASSTLFARPIDVDTTPGGRRSPPAMPASCEFTAQTRMSGIDLPDGRRIRKGAADAVIRHVQHGAAARARPGVQEQVDAVASQGRDAAAGLRGQPHRRPGRAGRHPQAGHARALRAAAAHGPADRDGHRRQPADGQGHRRRRPASTTSSPRPRPRPSWPTSARSRPAASWWP